MKNPDLQCILNIVNVLDLNCANLLFNDCIHVYHLSCLLNFLNTNQEEDQKKRVQFCQPHRLKVFLRLVHIPMNKRKLLELKNVHQVTLR